MKRIFTLNLLLILIVMNAFGQSRDLLNNKELDKLGQLNPAFTGVLNQFRILSNKGSDMNIGFESRILKGKNYFGAQYFRENLEIIERSGFKMAYSREIIDKSGVQVKLATGISFESKQLTETLGLNGTYLEDFDGKIYFLDSMNVHQFDDVRKNIDLSFGAGLTYKNLLFGLSAKHLNTPITALKEGSKSKTSIEISGELAGFIPFGGSLTVIPSAIYAQQDDVSFTSLGLGLRYKMLTIQTQYESVNNQNYLEGGVSFRYKRYFANISYLEEINSNVATSSSGRLRVTINASLFKIKDELGGIQDHIKRIY